MNIKKPENWTNCLRNGYELTDFVKPFSDEKISEFYNELKTHIESPESRKNDKYYKFMTFMIKNHPYNLLNAILSNDTRDDMTITDFESCIKIFKRSFWVLRLNSISRHFNFDIPGICEWSEVYSIYINEINKTDVNYDYTKDRFSVKDIS